MLQKQGVMVGKDMLGYGTCFDLDCEAVCFGGFCHQIQWCVSLVMVVVIMQQKMHQNSVL